MNLTLLDWINMTGDETNIKIIDNETVLYHGLKKKIQVRDLEKLSRKVKGQYIQSYLGFWSPYCLVVLI